MKTNFRLPSVLGTMLITFALAFLAACSAPSPAEAPVTAAPISPTEAVQAAPTAVEAAVSATSPTEAAQTSDTSGSAVSYSKDIAPLIQDSCVSCHGGEKTSRGLDLKTYDSMMAGSQNGAVIASGDAAGSKLAQSVQSGKMPKRGTKWTADQIQLLVNWINAGAQNN